MYRVYNKEPLHTLFTSTSVPQNRALNSCKSHIIPGTKEFHIHVWFSARIYCLTSVSGNISCSECRWALWARCNLMFHGVWGRLGDVELEVAWGPPIFFVATDRDLQDCLSYLRWVFYVVNETAVDLALGEMHTFLTETWRLGPPAGFPAFLLTSSLRMGDIFCRPDLHRWM